MTDRRSWALLTAGGCLEPAWVVAMKWSVGFTVPSWSIVTLAVMGASIYLMSLSIKLGIPVGTAYSIWVGIGAVGSLIAGILLFGEPSDVLRLFFVILIVVGIVGLRVTGPREDEGSA